MGQFLTGDEEIPDEQGTERSGSVPPERSHGRKPTRRIRMRARRSRSNDMAKRGMHQRRNKRVAW